MNPELPRDLEHEKATVLKRERVDRAELRAAARALSPMRRVAHPPQGMPRVAWDALVVVGGAVAVVTLVRTLRRGLRIATLLPLGLQAWQFWSQMRAVRVAGRKSGAAVAAAANAS